MLTKSLGAVFMLLLIFGVVAYASGWIQFHPNGDSTTIEMKTGEMQEAAEKAIDKTKQLIEKAGEKLEHFGDKDNVLEEQDREIQPNHPQSEFNPSDNH